jgi:hypothetical protein
MTLKRTVDETVNTDDLAIIDSWRTQMRIVALEEMLHLTLVNNMLAALGSAPHFSRPNFPVPPGRFPADLGLNLSPFNESTIQHFAYIERPLELDVPDGTAFRHIQLRAICITLLLLASIFWLNNWVRRCSLQGMVLLKLVVLNSPCPGFSL